MSVSVINKIVTTRPMPGHTITFATLGSRATIALTELFDQAGRLATALAAAGVGCGDRIGILAANRLEWVLLDLAALRLGAVTAGFEPAKFADEPDLISRYQLKALFTDPLAEVAGLIGGADPAATLPPVEYGPRDVTTIKFTSGSTGQPKGLAATVGSIDSSINAVQQMFSHGERDNVFVFLPLSLLQQRYWVYSALAFGHDITISTYEAAFAVMRGVEPTVVMGVPGFFESAMSYICSRAGVSPRIDVELMSPEQHQLHIDAGKHLFGTKIRYLWTGSAPARPEVLRFFSSVGMPIFEGYGLNETCIVAKNHPRAHRPGSVGQVLPGKKVLFDADGVISVASEQPVNWRYEYADPGESERVFAPDGTVRTGDVGYVDEDGFLYIKGRADDVIVLDNGKKVIVRPLEEYLKASKAIAEAVIFCPAQTHLVAVVSAADDPPDADAIRARLAQANASFGHDEQIKDLVIAAEPFSIDNGMLTSQFKPRRKRIMAAYVRQVNGF